MQLTTEAKLTAGEHVLQRWTWDFGELDNRSTVELISEPGDRFDPPDASYEPREAAILEEHARGDIDFEAALREFKLMAAAIERIDVRARPSMQRSKLDVGPITHLCSFCGRGREAVRKLIAGPAVAICDECISAANELANKE